MSPFSPSWVKPQSRAISLFIIHVIRYKNIHAGVFERECQAAGTWYILYLILTKYWYTYMSSGTFFNVFCCLSFQQDCLHLQPFFFSPFLPSPFAQFTCLEFAPSCLFFLLQATILFVILHSVSENYDACTFLVIRYVCVFTILI